MEQPDEQNSVRKFKLAKTRMFCEESRNSFFWLEIEQVTLNKQEQTRTKHTHAILDSKVA